MENQLDPRKTVLLLFDMLNGHIKRNNDPKHQDRYRPVIQNAVRLLDAARKHKLMVAYAYANHRADNRTTAQTIRDMTNQMTPIKADHVEKPVLAGGSWDSQVIDELAPRPEDYMIPKFRWSAFHQTYLDLALRVQKIDTIIISGGSTDVGVASTAYAARDLDYNLVFASDASTSHQMDSHEWCMKKIFPRMGRVRTTEQIVKMLAGD